MNPSIAPYSAMRLRRMSSRFMVIVIVTCVLLYNAYIPHAVTIATDSWCSVATHAQLKDMVTPEYVAAASLTTVYEKVSSTVTSALSMNICHDRPYHITVSIKTMLPCAVINDKYVLTCNAVLVPRGEYASAVADTLPCIEVLEEFFSQESRNASAAWIQQLPLEIIESYTIVWYARSHIELVLREIPSCVFIVWSKTRFSAEVIQAMQRIAQKNKRIDLRVPHYAIVSPILRGNL